MSRRSRALTAFMVVGAFATGAVFAQQAARDQRATSQPPAGPSGTGVLSGVVTSEDGGRPVRFAYLVLLGAGTGTVKVSASDADGKFAFANLPADRYTLGASKPPYLGTVAGAKRPGRSGTPIAVADGQKITNVAIRMPMGASISGVVTDEKGQSVSGISVTVQQLRMQGGERTLVPAPVGSRGDADERGRYRIYGLLPGEYVVTAYRPATMAPRPLARTEVDAALRGSGSATPGPTVPLASIRYAPVYYPGTTRANDAATIVLASGEDRVNVDFKLEAVQVAKVEGTVAGADGQVVTSGLVILTPSGNSPLRTTVVSRLSPDGRFSFPNTLPGTYTALMPGGSGPNVNTYAVASVEVNGADLLGVQLTMRPTMMVTGRMQFHGSGAAPALAGRRVSLRAMSPINGAGGPIVTPTTDTGAFTMAQVFPGAYVIGAPMSFGPTTDSMTWALESVTADGKDITDLPFEITPESLPKEVVVTYSDRFQELSGKLSRADGSPVSEYTIVVFPQDRAYWVTGSRRIVVTRPGTDGRFTLSGAGPTTLPAGKYYLAAVTDIDRNEQFDPAFLVSIVPAAATITLQPGEKKVQDLIVK